MSAQFVAIDNSRKQREGPVLSELTPLLLVSLGLRSKFSGLSPDGSQSWTGCGRG